MPLSLFIANGLIRVTRAPSYLISSCRRIYCHSNRRGIYNYYINKFLEAEVSTLLPLWHRVALCATALY